MSLSTHVLDAANGLPAAGVALTLSDASGEVIATGVTDADGRWRAPEGIPAAGDHRLHFAIGDYQESLGREVFHPEAVIAFRVADPAAHLHVPLLLSPYAYSTYRGS